MTTRSGRTESWLINAKDRAIGWSMAFLKTPGRSVEFVRYTGVSGASLALDIAAFRMIHSAGLLDAALAGAISCMVGLVLHYVLSVHVVFDPVATGKSNRRLIGEYAMTGVMGFAITWTSIWLVVDIFGLAPWLGKFVGIGLTFVSVYLVRAGVVFAPRTTLLTKKIDAGVQP
ncbi:MAG: GtrA family protein [Pseudomonadota bacterium]